MIANDSKSGENAAELVAEANKADPLGVMPDVGHLLPPEPALGAMPAHQDGKGAVADLTAEARKAEDGSKPLKNKKREQFCQELTGWCGDGLRKKNYEAYLIVYGQGRPDDVKAARANSTRLLNVPEVKARVEWLERKVEEAKRHDYRAAQQEIDELRLGLVERGKKNSKLAAVALAAARDFEAAHGLNKSPATETTEIQAVAGDGLGAVRAVLAKVIKRTE